MSVARPLRRNLELGTDLTDRLSPDLANALDAQPHLVTDVAEAEPDEVALDHEALTSREAAAETRGVSHEALLDHPARENLLEPSALGIGEA